MSDAEGQGPQMSGTGQPPAGEQRDRTIRAIRNGAGRDMGSAPKFSQPVRQIVMMLIVLALVIAGSWFAYRRIVSIFSANEVLNGVILLVFGLGVVTCFWQVAQLVNSVNWIERFALRRRNALERGAPAAAESDVSDAPRLLAPLAALLGGRGPMGGVISTASSRSILESVAARIDEARDITRYLANLLIFLGLLGTFYGLATTVPAVVETIRALQPQEGESGLQVFDKLMSGLEGQLGGMATAFSSSLLGLAGSLVVGLLELFATHGQNRFYRELEEWMSGFTRLGLSGAEGEGLDQATVAGFLDEITGQMADLHEYYLTRDASREAETTASEARISAMTKSIEGLAARLLEQGQLVAGQAEATGAALARMSEGQEVLAERLLAQGQAVTDHSGVTRSALGRMAEGQEQLAAQLLSEGRSASARAEEAGSALGRMADSQDRLTTQLYAAAEAHRAQAETGALALVRLIEGQDRLVALAANAAAAPAQSSQPSRAETEAEDNAAREAQMRLRSIDNQLARLVEEMASSRADMIGDLREDMAALTRAIRRLGQGDEA